MATLRIEVQNYLRSCEHLLATAQSKRDEPPFSPEELQVIQYYEDEIAKILVILTKQ